MNTLTRQGRRAATWWAYCWGRKRGPYGPAGPVQEHPDWVARQSVPTKRIYGEATARPNHPLKKTHLVRDQIVATHRSGEEVRYTTWLCGGTTFAARLTSTPPKTVCAGCLVVFQGRSVDPLPRGMR